MASALQYGIRLMIRSCEDVGPLLQSKARPASHACPLHKRKPFLYVRKAHWVWKSWMVAIFGTIGHGTLKIDFRQPFAASNVYVICPRYSVLVPHASFASLCATLRISGQYISFSQPFALCLGHLEGRNRGRNSKQQTIRAAALLGHTSKIAEALVGFRGGRWAGHNS